MIARFVLLFGFSALTTGAAAADATELQGEWKAVLIEKAGKRVPDAAVKSITVVIKGDTFTLKSQDKVVEEVTLAADAAKSPRQLTITPIKGPRKGMAHLGIYAAEKGKLKICWAVPGKDRPTTFATTAESGNFLIELEPAKP